MNDKIRKLYEEAKSFYLTDEYILEPSKEDCELIGEKFAELIVRECADLMNSNKDSDKHVMWNRALYETRGKIFRHFGVEE